MISKLVAASVLVAAVGGSTTLHDSNVSFKQALGACSGALGSVSFALGHARIAASPGIDTDESEPNANGMVSVTLQDASGAKSAKVSIDQRSRSVSAKNVRVEMRGNVACILPD
jgi:hypothetical protein